MLCLLIFSIIRICELCLMLLVSDFDLNNYDFFTTISICVLNIRNEVLRIQEKGIQQSNLDLRYLRIANENAYFPKV